jgi:Flp pilus assembly protein TadD
MTSPWQQRVRTFAGAAAILLLTVVAYQGAIDGAFLWDDDAYIVNNGTLRSLSGLKALWLWPASTPQYYPLVFTTFWLEYHSWGLEPLGYHLVNVLLHSLAAILFWRILHQLDVPGSWFAGAIFAVHPLEVESAAWITERKNVLSGVFYGAALLAYLRFHALADSQSDRGKRWAWYAAALSLYLAALLSKTTTCVLPAVLVLIIWWKQGSITRRDWLALGPFFVLGADMGLATAWIEKHHVGASGPEWQITGPERVLIAGRALWFYAGKLIWPANLTFIYPRWQLDAADWRQYLFPAAAIIVVFALWAARHRLGRGPVTAVLIFVVTLMPALGFLDVYPMRYSFVADHFQYLAGTALIALAVAGASLLLGRLVFVPGFAVVALLAALTWQRGHVYRSIPDLWNDTLARNPECWMAHNNLGIYYLEKGQGAQAAEHFLAMRYDNPDRWKASFNLGKALLLQKKPAEARAQFEEAIRLNPQFPGPYVDLGRINLAERRWVQAEKKFRQALQVDRACWEASFGLGIALKEQGRIREARRQMRETAAMQPGYAPTLYELGELSLKLGQPAQAVGYFRAALFYRPGDETYQAALAKAVAALRKK